MKNKKIITIQYLRAVAALGVLGAHTHMGFGEEGVDIFFVISGFIMMYIMDSFPEQSPRRFFLDRYFRIAPLYYLFTCLAILIGLAKVEVIHEILQTLTFLKYYKTAPLLETGWTLEYEFIFYGICTLSFVICSTTRARIILILSILLMLVIVIDFIIFSEKKYALFAEFGFGIFAFIIWRDSRFPNGNIRLGIVLFLFAFVWYGIANILYFDNFYYLRFIGFGFPSFILLLSVLTLAEWLPRSKVFEYLGNASYSIYLSHLLTLHVLQLLSGIRIGSAVVTDMLFFVISVLIGCVTYNFVEIPMTRSVNRLRSLKVECKQ